MRQAIGVVLVIVFFFVGRKGGAEVYTYFKNKFGWFESGPPPEAISTREWTDRITLPGDIVVDVPMEMKKREGGKVGPYVIEDYVDSCVVYASLEDSPLHLSASSWTYKPGAVLSLDDMVEGAVGGLHQTSSRDQIKVWRKDIRLLGNPAVELSGVIDQGPGHRSPFRAVMLRQGERTGHMLFLAVDPRHQGLVGCWDRIRDSIRFKGQPVPTKSKELWSPAASDLPPGVERVPVVQ